MGVGSWALGVNWELGVGELGVDAGPGAAGVGVGKGLGVAPVEAQPVVAHAAVITKMKTAARLMGADPNIG